MNNVLTGDTDSEADIINEREVLELEELEVSYEDELDIAHDVLCPQEYYEDMDWSSAAEVCPVVIPGNYGDCGIHLGYGFDGAICLEVLGCNCDEPGCRLFSSRMECADTCSSAGPCKYDKLPLNPGPTYMPICVGGFCDYINFCVSTPRDDTQEIMRMLFPEAEWSVDCDMSDICYCEPVFCKVHVPGIITAEFYQKMCAATLLAEVDHLDCIIYF